MTRTAHVQVAQGATPAEAQRKLEEVAKYLPAKYEASLQTDVVGDFRVVITGEDDHGWTLDDYVIPRLASGLIAAREVVDCPTCPGTMRPDQRQCNWCSV